MEISERKRVRIKERRGGEESKRRKKQKVKRKDRFNGPVHLIRESRERNRERKENYKKHFSYTNAMDTS